MKKLIFAKGDKIQRKESEKNNWWNDDFRNKVPFWKPCYDVESSGSMKIIPYDEDHDRNSCVVYVSSMEHVDAKDLDLADHIKKAQAFLNKKVYVVNKDGRKHENFDIPTFITVAYKFQDVSNNSQLTNEYLQDHDFCVVLNAGTSINFPYTSVVLAPSSKTVKLNGKYEAEVYQDKIVVGCQTFPITILKELDDALKSL